MSLNNISNPTITLLSNECGVITTLPMNVICETTNPTSFDSSDGEVSVLISGGTPPYVVTWNNGSLSQGLTNLKNGSYTATTVDYYKDYTSVTVCEIFTSKDCSFSGSSEIFIPPSPTPTKTPTNTPTPTKTPTPTPTQTLTPTPTRPTPNVYAVLSSAAIICGVYQSWIGLSVNDVKCYFTQAFNPLIQMDGSACYYFPNDGVNVGTQFYNQNGIPFTFSGNFVYGPSTYPAGPQISSSPLYVVTLVNGVITVITNFDDIPACGTFICP